MTRILIIDDDAGLKATVGLALSGAGYEVILAADGREGIEKHRMEPVDLVITDLFMEGQEGLETIQQMRKEFPQVLIIAMSGGGMSDTMLTMASKLGADKVLQKPFDAKKLLSAVREML